MPPGPPPVLVGPVQHLTSFTTVPLRQAENVTGSVGALNADQPSGYENAWTDAPLTDPSSNNLVDGPGLYRNQLVVNNALLMRTFRDGGSGRPQYRKGGTVASNLTLLQKKARQWGPADAGGDLTLTFDDPVGAGHLIVAVLAQYYVFSEGHTAPGVIGLQVGDGNAFEESVQNLDMEYVDQPLIGITNARIYILSYVSTGDAGDDTALLVISGTNTHVQTDLNGLEQYKLFLMEYSGNAAVPKDNAGDLEDLSGYTYDPPGPLRDTSIYSKPNIDGSGNTTVPYFFDPASTGSAVGAFLLSNNVEGSPPNLSVQPSAPWRGLFEYNTGGSVLEHVAGQPYVTVVDWTSAASGPLNPNDGLYPLASSLEGTPSDTSVGEVIVEALFDKA